MSVSTLKALLWSAIAIAIVMILATASASFDRNESLALFFGGCVLIVAATLWYRKVITAAEVREAEEQIQQLTTLKQQIELTGAPVSVKSSNGMSVVVLMLCLAIGAGVVAFKEPSADSLAMLALAVLMLALFGFFVVPYVGKPALVVRRDGLETAAFGFFRWEEIESIGLQSYTSRGATTHSLDLLVPRLSEREDQMHPLVRLTHRTVLRSRGKFVVIRLSWPSLPATLVHTLCYELWRRHTGRTRSWTAMASDHHIEEMQRADERFEMLRRAGDTAVTDPVKAMQMLDELERKFGDPALDNVPKKRLNAREAAQRDALAAELRAIDPRDSLAMKKVLEKHVKARTRSMTTVLVVVIVVLAALVVVVRALIGD